jgi:hypothetical protein
MRALLRARTLLAVGALFVLLAAPAAASKVGKPIDGPEGPPIPNPVEVGEPDTGHGLSALWREFVIAASLGNPVTRGLAAPLLNYHPRKHLSKSQIRSRR